MSTEEQQAAPAEAVQLQLIPDAPVEGALNDVPLSMLPDDLHGDPPSAAMVEGVRRFGVLQPIGLIGLASGEGDTLADAPDFLPEHVAYGRRRIKAARLAGRTTIPAMIYPAGWTSAAVLSLIENEQRRENPVADFLAILELVDGQHSESDICDATGLTPQTVRARLRLRKLVSPLKRAMLGGDIRVTVAEAACRLSEDLQDDLAATLEMNGKLTLADVKEVQQVATAKAAASLPDDMFESGGSLISVVSLLGEVLERVPGETPASYVKSARKMLKWLRTWEEAKMQGGGEAVGLELVNAA